MWSCCATSWWPARRGTCLFTCCLTAPTSTCLSTCGGGSNSMAKTSPWVHVSLWPFSRLQYERVQTEVDWRGRGEESFFATSLRGDPGLQYMPGAEQTRAGLKARKGACCWTWAESRRAARDKSLSVKNNIATMLRNSFRPLHQPLHVLNNIFQIKIKKL